MVSCDRDNFTLSHGTQQKFISILPEIQHSGDMFHKNIMKFGQRVDVFIAPVKEVLPCISYYLKRFSK
jgi:hypothetical protein